MSDRRLHREDTPRRDWPPGVPRFDLRRSEVGLLLAFCAVALGALAVVLDP